MNLNDSNNNYNWNGESFARKNKKKTTKLIALIITLTLLLTTLTVTLSIMIGTRADDLNNGSINESQSESNNPKNNDSNSGKISTSSSINSEQQDASVLYEESSISCATIYVTLNNGRAIGSGFVISEEGYIVTNHHVISGAKSIEVQFYNGDKYTAELIGSDSLSDIAVLKIEAENLIPIKIGDSDEVRIGDTVYAIGTPYDLTLAGTLTSGLISGVNRAIDVTDDYGKTTKTMILLQTDSSINPGNSGGPLLNIYGQVIGINTLKLMNDYEGIGFSIPITKAVEIINELIENGEISDPGGSVIKKTAKLNITGGTVNDALIQEYQLPENTPNGVFITEIYRNTAIYKAGVEIYDIITNFNGTDINTIVELQDEIAKYVPGDEVTIKIYRFNRNGTGSYFEFKFKLEAGMQ